MEFKRGDWVEVRDYEGGDWLKRIYLDTIEGADGPYVVIFKDDEHKFLSGKGGFAIHVWRHLRPIRPDLKVDDKVLVMDADGYYVAAHFAGWGQRGQILVWKDGTTSWTGFETIAYDKYKLP